MAEDESMAEDWITVKEASDLSGYCAQYIRRLVRKKKIKSEKWVRDWMISKSSLMAYARAAEKSKDSRKGPRT
jgi:excisionase family DNA binding protein